MIKLNKLNKNCNSFDNLEPIFLKKVFSAKADEKNIIIEFRIFE